MPKTWRTYILNRPIIGRIRNISNDIAVVRVGQGHGLREGMLLVVGNREPSMFRGLRIMAVAETTVEAEVFDEVKVGDTVSTRSQRLAYYSP